MIKIDNQEFGNLRELQLFAFNKGLLVVAGEINSILQSEIHDNCKLGYAVIKQVGGIKFVIDKAGRLNHEYCFDGPYRNWSIGFNQTLDEAREIVNNYKEESSPDYPKFYGFIRIFEGEDENLYYGVQKMLLEQWAEKNNIRFEEIFGCVGGYAEFQGKPANIYECDNYDGICNAMYSCKTNLEKLKDNDVLCITSLDRIDGHPLYWKESYNILDISIDRCSTISKYVEVPQESNIDTDDFPF